jgi:hypothetical protein
MRLHASTRAQGIDSRQEAPGRLDRLIGEDKNMRHDAEKAGLRPTDSTASAVRECTRAASIPRISKRIRVVGAFATSRAVIRTRDTERHTPKKPHAVRRESTVVSLSKADELEQQRRPPRADHVLGRSGKTLRYSGRPLIIRGRHRCARPLLRLECDNLHSSPAIRFAGAAMPELAGGSEESRSRRSVQLFPVAARGRRGTGLDERRPLTVTADSTFGGGPLNNYVMH